MPRHRVRIQLRWVLLTLAVLGMCGLALAPRLSLAGAAKPLTQQRPFTITSPDFTDGGALPQSVEFNEFCHGSNVAPTLNWVNVPDGTQSFALAMNDYDAPVAGGFHHWVVYNIPASVASLNGTSPFAQGTNSFGTIGYGGPCPPPNGQLHHYVFTLYALTVPTVAGQALTYDQLIQAISGHVAGATVIIGTFVRTSPSQ
jgi:Raf kinase inhibitor-like YbhB/YbcL family protein